MLSSQNHAQTQPGLHRNGVRHLQRQIRMQPNLGIFLDHHPLLQNCLHFLDERHHFVGIQPLPHRVDHGFWKCRVLVARTYPNIANIVNVDLLFFHRFLTLDHNRRSFNTISTNIKTVLSGLDMTVQVASTGERVVAVGTSCGRHCVC